MFTTVSQFEIKRPGSKPQIKNQNENDQSMPQSIPQTSNEPTGPINYYQSHSKLEHQSNISAQQIGSSHKHQGSDNIIQSPSKVTVEPDVQSNNNYQSSSSTTVMNRSSFTAKSESSQLIQSQNNQGPSQLLRPPAVSAAIRTDALSSSPSAASHLSDSSQSTVVRQSAVNDNCESGLSTVQISKSESRYENLNFKQNELTFDREELEVRPFAHSLSLHKVLCSSTF